MPLRKLQRFRSSPSSKKAVQDTESPSSTTDELFKPIKYQRKKEKKKKSHAVVVNESVPTNLESPRSTEAEANVNDYDDNNNHSNQQSNHKNPITIDTSLPSLGVMLDSISWEDGLRILQHFQAQDFGHPRHFAGMLYIPPSFLYYGFPLGEWVQQQRRTLQTMSRYLSMTRDSVTGTWTVKDRAQNPSESTTIPMILTRPQIQQLLHCHIVPPNLEHDTTINSRKKNHHHQDQNNKHNNTNDDDDDDDDDNNNSGEEDPEAEDSQKGGSETDSLHTSDDDDEEESSHSHVATSAKRRKSNSDLTEKSSEDGSGKKYQSWHESFRLLEDYCAEQEQDTKDKKRSSSGGAVLTRTVKYKGFSLGIWFQNQITEYRKFIAGTKSSMTNERYKLFHPYVKKNRPKSTDTQETSDDQRSKSETQGPRPGGKNRKRKESPNDKSHDTNGLDKTSKKKQRIAWNTAFKIFQQYVNEHNHGHVGKHPKLDYFPARLEYNGFPLGRWMANMRYEYNQYKAGNTVRVKSKHLELLENLLGDPDKYPDSLLCNKK